MMGFGAIFGVLILALIVWAIYQMTQTSSSKNPFGANQQASSGGSNALEILKQRYARGEISQDEFRKKKQELS